MQNQISLIILTYNEEANLANCLESVSGLGAEIFIVDSNSTDKTLEIAGKYGCKVFQHPFESQARQMNWALAELPIKTDWVIRLDADERVTPELAAELPGKLAKAAAGVTGFYFKRQVYFMGKWIKHGGYYPTWLLRIWRRGKAVCEERWMDEHMILTEGDAGFLENDICDDNKKPLNWWTEKHNSYATREAIELLNLEYGFLQGEKIDASISGAQDNRKRWVKNNLYSKLPLFLRAFVYFNYRYFLRFGFLDGGKGLIFHVLQGFWYRFLVDAKVYEVKHKAVSANKQVPEVITELYKVKL